MGNSFNQNKDVQGVAIMNNEKKESNIINFQDYKTNKQTLSLSDIYYNGIKLDFNLAKNSGKSKFHVL